MTAPAFTTQAKRPRRLTEQEAVKAYLSLMSAFPSRRDPYLTGARWEKAEAARQTAQAKQIAFLRGLGSVPLAHACRAAYDRQLRERDAAQAETHTLDLAGDYPKHILSARVQPGDEKGRKHGVAIRQKHSCGHEGVHLAPVGSCQLPFPWLCAECAEVRG